MYDQDCRAVIRKRQCGRTGQQRLLVRLIAAGTDDADRVRLVRRKHKRRVNWLRLRLLLAGHIGPHAGQMGAGAHPGAFDDGLARRRNGDDNIGLLQGGTAWSYWLDGKEMEKNNNVIHLKQGETKQIRAEVYPDSSELKEFDIYLQSPGQDRLVTINASSAGEGSNAG